MTYLFLELEWSWLNFVVTWLKIFKPNDSTKKLSQMVLSQVTGNPYVPILLSDVEQEQRPSANGVGAGLCDGEGERAYIVYDPILGGEKYLKYLNALQEQKNGWL